MTIKLATINEFKSIVFIDSEVIGNRSRYSEIKKAIDEKRCLISLKGNEIGGFLIFHHQFFGNLFIELVIVSPRLRRLGIAKDLMFYLESIYDHKKLFSSTNQSNEAMHIVFRSLGYVESGSINHLDEGDPEIIYVKLLKN